MKLKEVWIQLSELQDYLDKYQDKIKFMFLVTSGINGHCGSSMLLIIDEA